jgi:hypothetical protein
MGCWVRPACIFRKVAGFHVHGRHRPRFILSGGSRTPAALLLDVVGLVDLLRPHATIHPEKIRMAGSHLTLTDGRLRPDRSNGRDTTLVARVGDGGGQSSITKAESTRLGYRKGGRTR